MISIRTAHTADVDPAVLDAAHRMLVDCFDDFEDADWEHALGGMHALAWDGDELVGHASVVQRRLLHGGRALRAGYVEGVGVRADRRRQGIAGRLMEAIESFVRGGYDLGALGASDAAAPLYAGRGWVAWRGRAFALTPDGVVRTEDEEGGIYVLPGVAPLDLDGDLTCDWRDGDVW